MEKVAQSTNMLNPIRYKYRKYYKYYKYHKFIGQKNVSIRFQLSPIKILTYMQDHAGALSFLGSSFSTLNIK